MLTVDNAQAYLRAQGLISAEAVTEGDLDIISATRRNRNLQVTTADGSNYLIKQPSDRQSVAVDTLRREALFYAFCQQEPAAAAVRALLARLVHVDDEQALLILELLRDAQPLWRYYEASAPTDFPVATAAAVGRALGVIHQRFQAPDLEKHPRLAFLAAGAPWVLQVHRPDPDALAYMSAAHLQVIRILQSDPDAVQELDALRRSWQPQTVIHGDVKMDNFLVLPASDGAAGQAVRLVDWELVQRGDPAWDVGGALHDYVFFWVLSMPHEGAPADMAAAARHPLPVLRPAIRELWRSYCQVQGLTPAQRSSLLERAVRFSAARVIQTAYEMAGNFPVLPTPSVLMLQIGVNLLTDPEAGQLDFYGLTAEAAS